MFGWIHGLLQTHTIKPNEVNLKGRRLRLVKNVKLNQIKIKQLKSNYKKDQ